jgi:thioredoxin reductase (NADPH)
MEDYELVIIGGGPTGLFATFCAGLREIKSVTLESLETTGGQILKFYPIKEVLDVEGIPAITGKDLAAALFKQATRFGNKIVVNSKVTDIKKDSLGGFIVEVNSQDAYHCKAILIAAGIGSLVPKKLNVPGEEDYSEKGVYYTVTNLDIFKGKTVAIIGGGDAGFDWANQISSVVNKIYIIEYMPAIKAMESSVSNLIKTGKAELIVNTAVKSLEGDVNKLTDLNLIDRKTNSIKKLNVDAVVVAIGHKTEGNSFKSVTFDVFMNRIKVNDDRETNVPGIYAAGDVATSENKPTVGLIAVDGAEAYTAINNIKKYLNPSASVFGEHSTELNR